MVPAGGGPQDVREPLAIAIPHDALLHEVRHRDRRDAVRLMRGNDVERQGDQHPLLRLDVFEERKGRPVKGDAVVNRQDKQRQPGDRYCGEHAPPQKPNDRPNCGHAPQQLQARTVFEKRITLGDRWRGDNRFSACTAVKHPSPRYGFEWVVCSSSS